MSFFTIDKKQFTFKCQDSNMELCSIYNVFENGTILYNQHNGTCIKITDIGLVDQESIEPEFNNQDSIDPDFNDQDSINQDSIDPDFNDQDSINQDSINQDSINQDFIDQELINKKSKKKKCKKKKSKKTKDKFKKNVVNNIKKSDINSWKDLKVGFTIKTKQGVGKIIKINSHNFVVDYKKEGITRSHGVRTMWTIININNMLQSKNNNKNDDQSSNDTFNYLKH